MNSYTNLEQSKKLVEILPLESADMMYWKDKYNANYYSSIPVILQKKLNQDTIHLPCWSLAALISVLPLGIETHKQTDGDKIYYYVETYMKCMRKEIYLSTERYENLIDACVKMILTLNEQKLL